VFGVPLETLLDKSGVDSKHGIGLGRIRIPAFIDLSITALKDMGTHARLTSFVF
jgi:hypothetical protein